MIIYKRNECGTISSEDGLISFQESHRFYAQALEEVAAGEAVIIPFDHVAADAAQAIAEARAWRDGELAKADIEIYKLEDAGSDTASYRAYRIVLRDWPASESFPDDAGKPLIEES